MTDVMGCIRRAGEINYAFRASACMYVGSSFTYRKIRNARLFLAVLSLRLTGRSETGAGNIGQGIMIFAEGDGKSKMYADISDGYSYSDIRHGRVK